MLPIRGIPIPALTIWALWVNALLFSLVTRIFYIQVSRALSAMLPSNWPDQIEYLIDHHFSDAVTNDLRAALGQTTAENCSYPRIPPHLVQFPSPNITINKIDIATHPAYGQQGLFASQHLLPDSFICLYLGLVHLNSLSDTDPHSDYDLSLDRNIGLSIDAARCGNEARFANDYRGISERPNAEFRDCFIEVPSSKRAGGRKWERRVAIYVLPAGKAGKRKAGIRTDEEILVNYGKGFWEGRKLLAGFRKDEVMLKAATAAIAAE